MQLKDRVTAETDKNRKIELRRKGGYAILGGLIFALHGALGLGDTVTEVLLVALGFIYISIFPEAETKQPPDSLARKLFRFLVTAIGQIIVVIASMAFLWFWLSPMTGINISFLIATALTLAGLILIGWSYSGNSGNS